MAAQVFSRDTASHDTPSPHTAPLDRDIIYRERVRTWHRFTQATKVSVIAAAVFLILLAWVTL
ncbi:MAG TPA: aa3-type cytochrome c oxidase subunit IV [Azospirillaceae bacterium]|nr:aa3-type cytochrome c oxidase subunit IV [Azospirillaceae bacterium]